MYIEILDSNIKHASGSGKWEASGKYLKICQNTVFFAYLLQMTSNLLPEKVWSILLCDTLARFTYDPCFYGPSTIKSEPLLLRPLIKEKGLQCCQVLLRSQFNQETCTYIALTG